MPFGFLTARSSFLASGDDEEARRAAVARFELDPQSELEGEALAFLVLAMGDESWRVRKEAVARASGWADRSRAAQVLTEALSEPDNVGRRNAAIEALVSLGYDAVAPITDALQLKPEHRKVLVDTLGLIGDAAGASALVPLLDDGDANVRVAAAESLGLIGGGEAQVALRGLLTRGELLLTLAALDGLNKVGARLTAAELTPLVDQPTLRASALEALGRSGDLSALPRLIAGLTDGARGVREAAIVAVNELYPRLDGAGQREVQAALAKLSAIQPLVQALLEGTLGVQRAAARVLGLTRRADAVRPLTLALSDNELREDALAALVSIGSAGLETLVALAPDLEGRLRADVYALLPRFGPSASEPRVQGLLAEALEDEDVDAAAGAAQALGEVGTREALAPLLHALERAQGEETSAAQAAAQALGRLGTRHYEEVRILITSRGLSGPEAPHLVRVLGACGRESDAALLRGALGADSPSVRRAAAEALAQLGGTSSTMAVEIGDALLFALADEAPEVRAAAARALAGHPRNASVTAVDALERAAHDLEMAVRAAAARALGALALAADDAVAAVRPRAAAVLRRLAESNEAVAAVPALEALGRLGEPQDESRLIAALDKEDPEIVKAGARGLGARRDTGRSREALERALTDRRWDVRRAAALALGEHGPSAHPLLYARRTMEQDALVVEALEEAMQVAMGKRPRAR